MDTIIPEPNEEQPEVTVEVVAPPKSAAKKDASQEPVEVHIIRQERDLYLVGWTERGKSRRAWITPDMVVTKTDNVAAVTSPGAGVPYGVEWHRLIELGNVTPRKLEEELHRRGIWTIADLRNSPQEVVGAIQSTYAFARAQLLQAAERYEESLKGEK